MPGETSYQVIGRDGKPLERCDGLTDPASVARQVPDPWWGKAYGSLEAADHPRRRRAGLADQAVAVPTPTPNP